MGIESNAISEEALSNCGERVTENNTWSYRAHLSIYHFALPFAQGRRVLDAGSGSGYGSAYFARHGANVLAFEASPLAVEHSRQRYAGDPVTFEVADLNSQLPVGDAIFDLVFSSNVFEHVANIDSLIAECARVIKPDGVVIVAVPPVCTPEQLAENIKNQYHVNNIPPTAWHSKLSRFFTDVQCHAHEGAGEFAPPSRHFAEMLLPPDQVTIRETDFQFPVTTAQQMTESGTSITAVYVCRGRRVDPEAETIDERAPSAWHEGAVAARLIGEYMAAANKVHSATAPTEAPNYLKAELSEALRRAAEAESRCTQLGDRLAAIEASSSWKVTAPARHIVSRMLRHR